MSGHLFVGQCGVSAIEVWPEPSYPEIVPLGSSNDLK
jgi:hypothetical protein